MKPSFTIDSLLDKPVQVEDAPATPSNPKASPLAMFELPMYFDENRNDIPLVPIPPFDMANLMFGMNRLPHINPFSQQSVNLQFSTYLQNIPFMMPPVWSQDISHAQISAIFSDAISKLHTQMLPINCHNDVVLHSHHQNFLSNSLPPQLQHRQKVAQRLGEGSSERKTTKHRNANAQVSVNPNVNVDCQAHDQNSPPTAPSPQQQLRNSETAAIKQVDVDISTKYMEKWQREILEKEFSKTPRIYKKEEYQRISLLTGLTILRIKNWLCKKRYSIRRKLRASSSQVADNLAWWDLHLNFTSSQCEALTAQFRKSVDLRNGVLSKLMTTTNLSAKQIRYWFKKQLNALIDEKRQAHPTLSSRQIWELLEADGVHSARNQQTKTLN